MPARQASKPAAAKEASKPTAPAAPSVRSEMVDCEGLLELSQPKSTKSANYINTHTINQYMGKLKESRPKLSSLKLRPMLSSLKSHLSLIQGRN